MRRGGSVVRPFLLLQEVFRGTLRSKSESVNQEVRVELSTVPKLLRGFIPRTRGSFVAGPR